MKIVSLFDGMACGMLAMLGAGVEVDEYYAYEIDKYAVQTATHNFPNIIECGDVFKADFTQYKDVDFIVGGSPCTYWSIAQKNNRETEASGLGWELFSQYVRALNEIKPRFFIYENNKSMSKAIRESITKTFGFDAICINSALVSAQNRQRLYWVGKRNEDGTYSKVDVQQPEDRGILLRDILDSGVDLTSRDKSFAYTTRCNSAIPEDTIKRNRHTMIAEPINTTSEGKAQCVRATCYKDGIRNMVGNAIDKRTCVAEPIRIQRYGNEDKSRPVSFSYAQQGLNQVDKNCFPTNPAKQLYDYVVEPIQYEELSEEYYKGCADGSLVGMIENISVCRNGKQPSQQYRVYSCDSKSVCVDTDSRKHYIIPYDIDFNDSGKPIKATDQNGKEITIYEVHDNQIAIKGKHYPIKLKDGYYIIRKLSINECKRLQTVPEWYEFPVSNSQAYKMLGNGWTVEVIIHLIKNCLTT